ncbi:transmembrane protein 229B-like [Watersipora subatra]|uniref:transmembrane protein 229B-like n=1 Tax=Watersipora subatra TaxID=2589382 RepID=UPI00355C95AA
MPGYQMDQSVGLSLWWRLYIYALHGYCAEILFTAAWEFALTTKYTLMGTTSVWTMPIYGISGLVVEEIYFYIKDKLPLPLRCVVYVVWTYFWEFSTGYLLRIFGACPWDYGEHIYNFMGLVCLEYAPLWYVGSIFYDQILVPGIQQLQWRHSPMTVANGNKAK